MRRKLAYLTEKFPKRSETFIAREVLALSQMGAAPLVFSLQPGDTMDDPRLQELARQTVVLPPAWSRATVGTVTRTKLRHPVRHLRAVLPLVGSLPGDLRLGLAQWRRLGWAYTLAEALRREGVGHLHVHFGSLPGTLGWVASKLSGVPYSLSLHAWDLYVQRYHMHAKLRDATAVVCCHQQAVRHVAEHYAHAAAKTALVHHGLEADHYPMWHDAEARFAGRLRILAVGRLQPKKGFDTLLDAAALLQQGGVDFELTFIGDGPERDALADQTRRHALQDSVRFLGATGHDAVVEALGQATVLALPCRVMASGDRDGIPNVILEAMAAGLPVVVSDLPGPAEAARHEQEGLLTPPDDPRAVAEALTRLDRDRHLCAHLGQQGRRRVRQLWDPQTNARRLLEVIRESSEAG